MSAARDSAIPAPIRRLLVGPEPAKKSAVQGAIFLFYAIGLAGISTNLYHTPNYRMDTIQYMANALLMEERDMSRIHQRVYAEVYRFVPTKKREGLLGFKADAPEDYNKSRQERATNPERFPQFLPLFAIRPLYNQALWIVSKTGLGLVRAGVLLAAGSYFILGLLVFVWLRQYVSSAFTLVLSILLMLTPPMMSLGRETTSDPPATLVAFAALYLIFEQQRLLSGVTLLLASIYFRTDFVVLAGPVLLSCWLQRRIDLWKATVLALLAVGSVLAINHFAGDYGVAMLYYRNFVGVPIAPGEMTVHLSVRQYFSTLRAGIAMIEQSFFVPFLFVGLVGLTSRRMSTLFVVTSSYTLLHFLILPNWQERWFGVFYLSMAVCAATLVGLVPQNMSDVEEPAEDGTRCCRILSEGTGHETADRR